MPEGMSPGQESLGSHRAFQEAHLTVMSKDKLSYLESGKSRVWCLGAGSQL